MLLAYHTFKNVIELCYLSLKVKLDISLTRLLSFSGMNIQVTVNGTIRVDLICMTCKYTWQQYHCCKL